MIGLAAAFGALASYPYAAVPAAGGMQQEQVSPQEQAECLPSGTARSARNARTGALRFIGTAPGRPIAHPLRVQATGSPAAAARSYLSACARLFGLRDTNTELSLVGTERPDSRRSVVRFRQTHQGVPVIAGELLIVHVDAQRQLLAVTGKTLPGSTVDTTPAVSAANRPPRAGDRYVVSRATYRTLMQPGSELDARALDLRADADWSRHGAAALVWRMDVAPQRLLPDPRTGARGRAARISHAALQPGRHGARIADLHREQRTVLPGTLVCDERIPRAPAATATRLAHISAGDTYNFYLNNLGRDSIDNAGMTLMSTVHFSASTIQRFLERDADGLRRRVGYPLADDVVGHELTHGVTQYTSNLFYYYQSGAINESLSDVFGEFVDQTNGRGNDSAGVKWLMGEDVAGLRRDSQHEQPAGIWRSGQDDQRALLPRLRRQRRRPHQQRGQQQGRVPDDRRRHVQRPDHHRPGHHEGRRRSTTKPRRIC